MSGYVRNPRFEVNDMTDGIVLFDPDAQVVHHLNGPATLVWEVLPGRDVPAVAAAVAEILEVGLAEARTITDSALGELVRIGALQG